VEVYLNSLSVHPMASYGVTLTFKCLKQRFLRTKHNPSSYDCMIRSLEPRLSTTVTRKTRKDLRNEAQCLLLWSGARVDAPPRPQTDQRHADVITLRNRLAMGQHLDRTATYTSKTQIEWTEVNPAQLLHLCPLFLHD